MINESIANGASDTVQTRGKIPKYIGSDSNFYHQKSKYFRNDYQSVVFKRKRSRIPWKVRIRSLEIRPWLKLINPNCFLLFFTKIALWEA